MEKRSLTEMEILDIIDSIRFNKFLFPSVTEFVQNKIKDDLIDSLRQIKIYPSKIDDLKQEIIKKYYQSQIAPGESVGVVCAQNIGERCTQWTLDSFHYSGTSISTVVTGVPRFAELLSATKNPKNVVTNVYFKHPQTSLQQLRDTITNKLIYISFKEMVAEHTVSLNASRKKWYSLFDTLYDKKITYTHRISFKLDDRMLFKYKLCIRDIAETLERANEDISCIFSPIGVNELDVWLNASESDTEPYQQEYFLNRVASMLSQVSVCGIEGLHSYIYKEKETKGEWYLEVLGYNLYDIFDLSFVDCEKTYSNNMWEIYNVLGIEAVREFLLEEFTAVICSDSFVHSCHIKLLVDTMCYVGNISSINRYGVHRNQSGPLTKASFEESLDNFLTAGLFGEIETTKGVSASVMCGKPAQIGTGLCDVMYQPNSN